MTTIAALLNQTGGRGVKMRAVDAGCSVARREPALLLGENPDPPAREIGHGGEFKN